jgi:hypothetical protein
MKKLVILLFVSILFSCEKDDGPIVLETVDAVLLEGGGVELFGKIENLKQESNYGFTISPTSDAEFYNSDKILISEFGPNPGEFSMSLKNELEDGRTYYYKTFLNLNGVTRTGEEKYFISNGSASPEILEVNPESAYIGDTIRISGQHFSNNFKLYFNEIEIDLITKSDTLAEAVVPYLAFREEPFDNLKIRKSTSESAVFEDFELFKPEVVSVEPYQAHENDTITITGNHFDLIKEQNKLSMLDSWGYYQPLQILESSRTHIKFVIPNSFYNVFPKMRLQSQYNTIDFDDKYRVIPPVVTNFPECLKYDEQYTITGEHFPFFMKLLIGDYEYTAQAISENEAIFTFEKDIFTDFNLGNLSIDLYGELITYDTDICIDEPWINVGAEQVFNKTHKYQNETYAIVSQVYNSPPTVAKFNEGLFQFESVLDQPLPQVISFGSKTWHQDKLYNYDTNDEHFYSYNFLTGVVTQLSPFPGVPRNGCFITTVGDYIYLGFGQDNTNYYNPPDDIWRYSINSDVWEFVLTFPGIDFHHDKIEDPLVFAFDNRLFFSGRNSNNQSNKLWEVDLNDFSLIQRADVPINGSSKKRGITVGDKGYFESFYLYEYDLVNDQWTQHTDINLAEQVYPTQMESFFYHSGNFYRTVYSSYFNNFPMFKMNMDYLND